MKNIYCLLIVSFLCIFSLLPAGAQTLSEKDFQVLNMNDGLSDNDIHSVAKDTEGFMWFGTGSGLNRYDGRTFKVFRMPGISYRRIDRGSIAGYGLPASPFGTEPVLVRQEIRTLSSRVRFGEQTACDVRRFCGRF